MKWLASEKNIMILAGILIGLVIFALSLAGNPDNMALCSACFLRDAAGALNLHQGPSYLRPEIPGIVLGAFLVSLIFRDHSARGGSMPLTRFTLGVCLMVGSMIFLGCPLRLLLRIAGGDLNAAVGVIGFVPGIATGVFFLNRGFTLERSYSQPVFESIIAPVVSFGMLVLLFLAPAALFFSDSVSGSLHAPIWISLLGGLTVGAAAQRVRLCFVSSVRDAMLFKHFETFGVIVALFVTVLSGNALTGRFNLGFTGQPFAHGDALWNILGLYLAGFSSVLLGGCPLRQLVMAGSGNSDAGFTVLGLLAGSALAHNFGLVSVPSGATVNGKAAFVVCILLTFCIAAMNTKRLSKEQK